MVSNPQCLGTIWIYIFCTFNNVLLFFGAILTVKLAIPQTKDLQWLQHLKCRFEIWGASPHFESGIISLFCSCFFFFFLLFLVQHFLSQLTAVLPNWTSSVVSVPTGSPLWGLQIGVVTMHHPIVASPCQRMAAELWWAGCWHFWSAEKTTLNPDQVAELGWLLYVCRR